MVMASTTCWCRPLGGVVCSRASGVRRVQPLAAGQRQQPGLRQVGLLLFEYHHQRMPQQRAKVVEVHRVDGGKLPLPAPC